jgi:hypothetical protein
LNGRREDLGFGISQYCWVVSFGLGLQYRYGSLLKVKNKKAIWCMWSRRVDGSVKN